MDGEDRAMTNFILAKGYDTVYQGSAEVYTVVPESYKKLYRMYLRWDFLYGVLYSYFSFLTLLWVFPYALLTIRSRSWMTR